jgi:hypothetical protein
VSFELPIGYKQILQIHDEIILEGPEKHKEAAQDEVIHTLAVTNQPVIITSSLHMYIYTWLCLVCSCMRILVLTDTTERFWYRLRMDRSRLRMHRSQIANGSVQAANGSVWVAHRSVHHVFTKPSRGGFLPETISGQLYIYIYVGITDYRIRNTGPAWAPGATLAPAHLITVPTLALGLEPARALKWTQGSLALGPF